MTPHSLEVYEPGGSIPSYRRRTLHPNPRLIARRYLRWVNYIEGRPGGVYPCIQRIRIYKCGVWPEGDTYVGETRVRKERTR